MAEPSWEDAEANIKWEERALWNAEWELRHRCDGLTPLETIDLAISNLWEQDKQCLQDVEKLLKYFGGGSGGNAACKRLLKWIHTKYPVVPGQVPSWCTAQFSLGRHLMLAERQAMHTCIPANAITCRCFAATYVMGAGCLHNKTANYKAAQLSSTLCASCSICFRCQKFPA